MKTILYFSIIVALIPFAFVSCGDDEDGSASIRGKVTDEAGNQIPDANISIYLNEEQSTSSESNGEFHFTNL
nr:carboxypeptidase regulatory-like domain-containing protein [bacterium]